MRRRTIEPVMHSREARLLRLAGRKGGFSLVELLVVIGILAVLIGLLVPALAKARGSADSIACQSNLRQLHQASMAYAVDNRQYLPPAHFDFVFKNLHRWHGTRTSMAEAFDFSTSPLKRYLQVGAVKQCGTFEPDGVNGFERSAGGYGYNDRYLGSSLGVPGVRKPENVPAKISMVLNPATTIMFADAAIANPMLIEYSFAEPPLNGTPYPPTPSIHFRHRGFANVVWLDGHVTSQRMEWTYPPAAPYWVQTAKLRLGYFGPKDNTLFDRR